MKKLLLAGTLALSSTAALGQALHCPVCVGPDKALQYTGTACICGTISGATGPTGPSGPAGPQGPAGPAGASVPASTCTAEQKEHWNGTAWVCIDTRYLIAE